MRYFFDTEFIERPCTIDLISIGIVAENGDEFYVENASTDWQWANPWVLENVKPHLIGAALPLNEIGPAIRGFIGNNQPDFWGYYADYDWVVFCWLFGTMMDLPQGWPMYCRDLKQWCDELGNPRLPKQESTEHNALADARWNREAWRFLQDFEKKAYR